MIPFGLAIFKGVFEIFYCSSIFLKFLPKMFFVVFLEYILGTYFVMLFVMFLKVFLKFIFGCLLKIKKKLEYFLKIFRIFEKQANPNGVEGNVEALEQCKF